MTRDMDTYFRTIEKFFFLLAIFAWASHAAAATQVDCAGTVCPAMVIKGDREATLPNGEPSPFRGFSDATVRQDPESGRLWMAYSWPSIATDGDRRARFLRRGASRPQVDIHLAYSDDRGRHWQLAEDLWHPSPATSPDGKPGHMSHEVANLLPVREKEGAVWYGARLDYFLPDDGGFRKRPPESFRIVLAKAERPAALRDAPAAKLGSMATGPSWGMDVNLAALSPETRHCMLWNEPALFHDGKELFLALSCMAFRGKTPDLERSDLVVYASRADGPPSRWQWRYAGRLAGTEEARELGGGRLTQIDLARARDGKLLAIMTPDTWDAEAQDFVHLGCVAVEVDARGEALRLARDAEGRLKVRARVTASDAGAAGTAACTYDAASETGIILGKRNKQGVGLGHARDRSSAQMHGALHATGVHP
ncbi:MAG: hypothetical protein EFKGCFLK_01535 [Rhodocyclaceae bacterium]|nr:hypothetical protein [Rhodocyclaceae bacterium]CAG0929032.1 hypothetical protein RHDC3_00924 [Rhodocyclaceae bacterium]